MRRVWPLVGGVGEQAEEEVETIFPALKRKAGCRFGIMWIKALSFLKEKDV